MIHAKAAIAPVLVALACAGCGREPIAAAQANTKPDIPYETEFNKMYDAIPDRPDSKIEDYQ